MKLTLYNWSQLTNQLFTTNETIKMRTKQQLHEDEWWVCVRASV